MEIIKTKIDGVVIVEPKVFGDHRGFFMESWSKRHTAQTMVARIFTATHFALATKRRNATRSAGTEQGYSNIIVAAHYSELIFLLFRIFLPILPTLRFCEEHRSSILHSLPDVSLYQI